MGFVGRVKYESTWTCDECERTVRIDDSKIYVDMLDRTVLVPIPAPKNWAIMRWKEKSLCPKCIDKVLDTE